MNHDRFPARSTRVISFCGAAGHPLTWRQFARWAGWIPLVFDADSFRERGGTIGKGVNCFMLKGSRRLNFFSEDSVEPTSDSKTIVSAKFMPNG
ncbi:hypothetical protein [Bradyrhizobium sp. 6(2017)]|uniref:hypothetical protein n=1 Tax=Bradyrhizobium sp. 6(2017) TaxID=1197460 RepID=UPI0013E14758|nr:hypothetical protein [Bradyrhizobium sp. 6(2017)]QIG96793.1 hypothetical protein G6P99_33235 [Bradyrhizobium sp. 6(2017)]